jgi:hypothetical protein
VIFPIGHYLRLKAIAAQCKRPNTEDGQVHRAAKSGTIVNWSIDRTFGISVLRGIALKRRSGDGKFESTMIALRLLWWSHGVFGCTDGTSEGHTHTFQEGTPALEPFPFLEDRKSAEDSAAVFLQGDAA